MQYDPLKHHRQSIRLKDYNYAQAGFYFITFCTHNHEMLFGEIINDGVGNIVLEQTSQYGDERCIV